MNQKAFIIHPADNVATAIDELKKGDVKLIGGERNGESIAIREVVRFGFKIALEDFKKGESVIKNNAVIGKTTEAVKKGSMMHLHNITSEFDERSGSFDKDTGAPTEEDVYL